MAAPQAILKPEEVYLSVLCHYLVHPPALDQVNGQPFPPMPSSQRIALFLLKLLKTQQSACYPGLHPLCFMLVDQLGNLGAELVRQLEVILQGLVTPDDLANIMEAMGGLLLNSKAPATTSGPHIAGIDPGSVIGLFLRRIRASFQLAPYSSLLAATSALQQDLRDAAAAAAATSPGAAAPPPPHGALKDLPALSAYLTAQIQQVKRKGAAGCDAATKQLLDRILAVHAQPGVMSKGQSKASRSSSVLPRVLKLQLEAALAEHDYTRALHCMHAYFDHVQASGMPTPLFDSDASGSGASGQSAAAGEGQAGKARHHSALLSLAALHTHFGHTQEALDSLSEALRGSSQQADPWCLLHALAALCALLDASLPGAPGLPPLDTHSLREGSHHVQLHQLLTRCLDRAQELHCPHLAIYARLALAKWAVQHTIQTSGNNAETALPRDTVQLITKGVSGTGGRKLGAAGETDTAESDELGDWKAGMDSSTETVPAVQLVQLVLRQVEHVAHLACLEAAAPPTIFTTSTAGPNAAVGPTAQPTRGPVVPELYGTPHVFNHPSIWGCAAAIAASTRQHAASGRLLCSSAWHCAGSLTLSHCASLAYLTCDGGRSTWEGAELALAQIISTACTAHGPRAARAAVSISQSALPASHPRSATLLAVMARSAHEDARAQGHHQLAQRLLSQLESLVEPAGHVHADIQLETLHTCALGHLAAGNLSAARDTALRCFQRSRQLGEQAWCVRSLLCVGRVWLAAGCPSKAMPNLHSALLHAQAVHHDLTAAEAGLLLARAWLDMCPQLQPQVITQLQDLLPLVCAHGGLALQSEMQWLLADTLLKGVTSEELRSRSEAACQLLKAAMNSKERLGRVEEASAAGQLLAVLYDRLGDVKGRDDTAQQVLDIQQAAVS